MSYPNLPPVLDFELRHHHPNPDIDDMLHGDRTRTDEDGNEIIDEGTPEPPVVIEPEPDPDPPNPNPGPAPNPNPGTTPTTQPAGDSRIDPLTKEKLDALTQPGGVPTDGVFRGGAADEFIFGDVVNHDPVTSHISTYGGDGLYYGGDGNDVLVGAYLDGGPGNDYLISTLHLLADGRVTYGGGDAASILKGGPGNDYLESGGPIEILDGGPGNDHLVTSADIAALIGGTGRDVFDVTDGHQAKILDFQDGEDKILIFTSDRGGDGPREYLDLYNLATRAGVQIDMRWIATEVDDGVTLPLENPAEDELTIEGAYLHNLQFELVNGDLFIV